MYRILLLTASGDVESQVGSLLTERMKSQFLLRSEIPEIVAIPLINERSPDVVLLDFPSTAFAADTALQATLARLDGLPVIALTSEENTQLELMMLQRGAQDCLLLPELTSRALTRAIRHAIERALVERRLAQEREMLNSLLDQLPARIYFKDRSSRFLRVNKALVELFDVQNAAEVIGKADHDFFTSEHAQSTLRDEQEIIRTGKPILSKLEKKAFPSGKTGWALTTKLPLRSSDGEITGTFGISHDITQMKALEEAVDAERLRFKELSEELHAKNLQLEQDLVMAKGIQEAMLPDDVVIFPAGAAGADRRFHISSLYRPASAVGGDFFTIVPISDERVGVLICDIMGHGLRAALGTAILRGLVEQLQADAAEPDRFLTSLNFGLRAILRNIDEPVLVTAFYLVADLASGAVQLGTAGHPGPLLLNRCTGEVEEVKLDRKKRGPALALFDDAVYGMEEFQLDDDELLLLFTDGVIELSDSAGRVIGIEHFLASARRHVALGAEALCRNVLDDIQRAAGGIEFDDDVCLVALERRGGGES